MTRVKVMTDKHTINDVFETKLARWSKKGKQSMMT
jgi:hypothetical protein